MALQAHDIYGEVTVRMARVLGLVARHYSQHEAATVLRIPRSTVRDDVAKAEQLTGCENQRELGRWWLENRVGWLLWLMECLEIDRGEVAG